MYRFNTLGIYLITGNMTAWIKDSWYTEKTLHISWYREREKQASQHAHKLEKYGKLFPKERTLCWAHLVYLSWWSSTSLNNRWPPHIWQVQKFSGIYELDLKPWNPPSSWQASNADHRASAENSPVFSWTVYIRKETNRREHDKSSWFREEWGLVYLFGAWKVSQSLPWGKMD